KVGIFVEETAASVEAVMRAANLDIAQLYAGEAPEGRRVWKAVRVSGSLCLETGPELGQRAEAVLLDGPSNGVGFDWTLARGLDTPVILAGGLDASNVAEAIRVARPWGVDASSRLEESPGVKDAARVRMFVQAARQAFEGQE